MDNVFLTQLKRSAIIGKINSSLISILQIPNNIIQTNFNVYLNNNLKQFQGYRVQHNNLLGPYKGGVRYNENVDLQEVTNLASWMTMKTALLDIPYGGGKGGIVINLNEFSEDDIEVITRGFIQSIHKNLGSDYDIPAPDVGTNSKIIDVMVDEYNNCNLKNDFATFTGKSISNGGSIFRTESTGYGVGVILNEYLKKYCYY